ncbi:MAG: sensor histidine kinase, partial [Bacteroidota bacterium]
QYGATLKKLIGVKDSIYKINSATALAEMQTKYEVQKKENTIIQQNYNLTRKNYFIYGIAIILAATLLSGYAFLRNRKKTQQLKIQHLEAEQKQKTIHAVMQAEEEERKRIAGDLHDSVAQKMVVAKMNLESLGNKINEMSGPEQKIYQNIATLLEESTTEVRNLSHSMMPQAFSHSGLTDAVKDFLDKVPVRDLQIHFDAEGDFTGMKENTSLMIYRVIQEAVQNVLKHAKATTLDIAMITENNECDITIEDNGIGFNSTAPGLKQSAGLKNIQSRIDYLNGKLEINSHPGKGTVLAFFIPLNNS